MLSLDFLKGPLMNAASVLGKMPPGAPPMTPGTSPTSSKPMLGGMLGKAGKFLAQLPPGTSEGAPSAQPSLVTPSFDPLANRMPAVRLGAPDRVEDVPIPALPNRTGGPRPYDPQTKAEFEYVMNRMPHNEDGSERKLTFGERFKKSLLPALLGTVQGINSPAGQHNPVGGAIGGAVAGFGGGMLDPVSARQYEWGQMYKPEMDVQEQRQDQMADDKRKADESLVNLDARRAGIDYTRAQTDAMKNNNQANAAYKQSQIALNEARVQALATGKPQVRDIVDENGQIRTYQVHGDGSMVELGGSARAAMNTENNTTRRTIADNRNTTQVTVADKRGANALAVAELKDRGQTGRTAMVQAGQNQRAVAAPGGSSAPKTKPAGGGSRQAWIDRAVKEGFSRAEAEAYADRKGLK